MHFHLNNSFFNILQKFKNLLPCSRTTRGVCTSGASRPLRASLKGVCLKGKLGKLILLLLYLNYLT